MRQILHPILAVACVLVACCSTLQAQGAGAPEVNVRTVKFGYPRTDGAQGPAMEAEIELDVRGSIVPGRNPRFVDRVRVALMLAIQARGRTAGEFQYYYAEAEAVTLETGTRTMRFYLPPEIVRRDGISGEPYAHFVEVAVGERVLPPRRASLSDSLRSRERFDVFLQKVTESRTTNDGILVPQHLFNSGYTDGRETPSVLRKSGR